MTVELISIAAVAENGVIGSDGGLPWHYPDDLQHFKETTVGHPIIMGRVTFESFETEHSSYPPNRTNIVLTTREGYEAPEDVEVVHTVEEAIATAEAHADETAYVIGGEAVYEAFMPHVDRLLLTHIPDEYDGDTHFPGWGDGEWKETDRWNLNEELTVVEYEP